MYKIPEINEFAEQIASHHIEETFLTIIQEVLEDFDKEPRTAHINTLDGFIIRCLEGNADDYVRQASVPLYRHSLSVARAIIDATPENERHGLLFSALVLLSVAHDVGILHKYRIVNKSAKIYRQDPVKLPYRFRNMEKAVYDHSEHPLLGAKVIYDFVKGRLNSAITHELSTAIRFHHMSLQYLSYHGYFLAERLFLADRKVCRRETREAKRITSSFEI